ncbi:hypothetical protein BSKO_02063 [Bryopsis sp. KO-2023]|nr:hypothetical protein BSKO_02063 [Bryopsis sp. KO-2023]
MLRFAVGILLLLNGVAGGRRLLQCEQTSTEAESEVEGALSQALGDIFSLALSSIQKCENEDLFGPGEKELSAAFAVSINNVADELEACGEEDAVGKATAIVNKAALNQVKEFEEDAAKENPEAEEVFEARTGFLEEELSESEFSARSLFDETVEEKGERAAEGVVKFFDDVLGALCGTTEVVDDGEEDCRFDGEKFVGSKCVGRKLCIFYGVETQKDCFCFLSHRGIEGLRVRPFQMARQRMQREK